MLPKHINKISDIVTSRDDVRKGFLIQAITKSESTDKFIEKAKEFHEALKKIDKIEDLLILSDFREELIAAAGFSQKATNHLSDREVKSSLKKVFKQILTEENKFFRDEIVYRYLLTKGDSLGGTIRNKIGLMANEKLTAALLKALRKKKIVPKIEKNSTGKIQNIRWSNRYLAFDYKPRLIGKNIDLILLNISDCKEIDREVFDDPSRYLACGELKGGIDPAGADEHWKTANSALGRIRARFAKEKNKPALFFVGNAIESSMAEEIFRQLQEKKLIFAANFNHEEQIINLVEWLTSL